MKIVISSGHGKYIRGASGYIDEVDEARLVVERVADVLRDMGDEVTTYHDDVSDDQTENLNRIVDFHNSKTRDLDVSVHFNAYETTSKPMGSEVLFVTQEDLANTVVDKICSASGLINRGPKYRGDLFFLNNTEERAILVETCFVDSKSDVDIYHAKFEEICRAIAGGITGEGVGPGPKPEPPVPVPPEPVTPGPMPALEGKPLRYLIGGEDDYEGAEDEVIELSYDATRPPSNGVGVKYGNLFNEKYDDQTAAQRAKYEPYLEQGDTAEEYNEGQIDPAGQGWFKNLDEQIRRAKTGGFAIIEWDNPDSYQMEDVLGAVERAHAAGLYVFAKNPAICKGSKSTYVGHPAVVGIVVEEDCGEPSFMEALRIAAGKPTLPVWFVAYGNGRDWADRMAKEAAGYVNMGVTFSSEGEYENSEDILVPNVIIPPTPPFARPVLEKGDKGPDVAALQKSLGIPDDGDFGPATETQVMAFQAAVGLGSDGIVGPSTWEEVDLLDARMAKGSDGLTSELVADILEVAEESSLNDYNWPERGQAPPGYIPGMCLCFALAVSWLQEGKSVATTMAQRLGDDDVDALTWYEDEFNDLDMGNDTPPDRLRHLFVLLTGLGMRESSGRYCEGRDMSADNVSADTCEAGLFQSSWNFHGASSQISALYDTYWADPNGFLETFNEGITPSANNLNCYGTGTGAAYQWLAKFSPAFAVMTTAVGLRVIRQHWGPINRHEVDIVPELDELLLEVQELIVPGA